MISFARRNGRLYRPKKKGTTRNGVKGNRYLVYQCKYRSTSYFRDEIFITSTNSLFKAKQEKFIINESLENFVSYIIDSKTDEQVECKMLDLIIFKIFKLFHLIDYKITF